MISILRIKTFLSFSFYIFPSNEMKKIRSTYLKYGIFKSNIFLIRSKRVNNKVGFIIDNSKKS